MTSSIEELWQQHKDTFMMALTAWRENRGGGLQGMQSIINVIVNRTAKNHSTPYAECVKSAQFTSITGPGDPELNLWPLETDPLWSVAGDLAGQAAAGTLGDLTNGATLYYNPRTIKTDKTVAWLNGTQIPFPATWNPAVVTPVCELAGHVFFRA
jgi:hypothetical protein